MAHFQQILQGESYCMGSLVAVAVFQIRQGCVEVIECDDTEPSIKNFLKFFALTLTPDMHQLALTLEK